MLQEAIKNLSYELFHEHKHITDQEMKERLKTKLNKDEYCVQQLRKLQDKGCSFDQLWEDKLLSAVSI